jgi:oligosaccharide repeat unit polymerase
MPDIISNISTLTLDMSYAADIYTDSIERDLSRGHGGGLNYITAFGSIVSDWAIFMAFYYSTLKGKSHVLSALLWLCSIYPLLSGISGGARAIMSYWVFDIIVAYLLFRNFFSNKLAHVIRIVVLSGVFLMVSVFALLTIGRFTSGAYQNGNFVGSSIVSYLGQGTLNFNQYVLNNDVYQYGDNTMPLFRKMVGLESSSNIRERQAKWSEKMKIVQGYFYTFVGDFYFDWGPLGTFFLMMFLSIYLRNKIRIRGDTIHVKKLFLIYFWSVIINHGLFYYSFKTVSGNWHFLSFIIFYVLLSIIKTRENVCQDL